MLVSFDFELLAQNAGSLLDAMGVAVILLGVVASTLLAGIRVFKHVTLHNLYISYRHNLARSVLIGLEFLVAGDIIRSVAGDLSLDSVVILAIVVIIRSLLGIEFEMEIDGRWPWQRNKTSIKNKPSEEK